MISAIALFASCAQIGTVSGGDTDVNAPSPLKSTPENASTNFSGNEISITFDEYFKLVSPAQKIVMIPPHATINISVRKKTLTLSWEDTLNTNTTYSIYLNGAVADITEGNDSIYQYVFSTGNELDSISYTSFIADARTGDATQDVTLICYDSEGRLVSLGKTHSFGEVSVRYLKPGTYSFIAVEDINNNLEIDNGESVGFPDYRNLSLDSSMTDSTLIRMFKPKAAPRLRSAKFISPASVFVGATETLESSTIFIDGNEIKDNLIQLLERDSVQLFPESITSGHHELVVKSDLFTDTINFRVPRSIDSTIRISSLNNAAGIAPSEEVSYKASDRILKIQKDSIHLFNVSDSISISDFEVRYEYDRLYIKFDRDQIRDVKVTFGKDAVTCSTGTSKPWVNDIVLNELRSYGQLMLDHSAYQEPIILELFRGGQLIRAIKVENVKELTTVSELPPGDYTINVIVDRNKNGRWDTGDLEQFVQPEEIDRYSEAITVRANWDLEVPLEPRVE